MFRVDVDPGIIILHSLLLLYYIVQWFSLLYQ